VPSNAAMTTLGDGVPPARPCVDRVQVAYSVA
jgi:hypothetical protein